jgi:hypothetical protein
MSDKDFCNDIVALIKGVDEQRELMSNVGAQDVCATSIADDKKEISQRYCCLDKRS